MSERAGRIVPRGTEQPRQPQARATRNTRKHRGQISGTHSAWAPRMSRPNAHVVVAESGLDAARALREATPRGDVNHVLCRGSDEPLADFASRVFHRIRTLKASSSLEHLSYLLGPNLHENQAARQVLLRGLLVLLGRGSELELVAGPTSQLDVLETLDALVPFAKPGVGIKLVQQPAGAMVHDDELRSGVRQAIPRPQAGDSGLYPRLGHWTEIEADAEASEALLG